MGYWIIGIVVGLVVTSMVVAYIGIERSNFIGNVLLAFVGLLVGALGGVITALIVGICVSMGVTPVHQTPFKETVSLVSIKGDTITVKASNGKPFVVNSEGDDELSLLPSKSGKWVVVGHINTYSKWRMKWFPARDSKRTVTVIYPKEGK